MIFGALLGLGLRGSAVCAVVRVAQVDYGSLKTDTGEQGIRSNHHCLDATLLGETVSAMIREFRQISKALPEMI
ncbi:hypothetical protein BD289DRAFT_437636 [Coniella lustricola]|uniref:Uncharacterized protein n=1 Tax=Coniella lustricola TaxID=2025994 RepID=A0A2T3A3R5_9PEZI|nr:hypothetical protein BD289DRAFT_437636 [Coniella lustricola]